MAEITVAGGTRVGFSANKTLEEAKSLNDNRLVICKGHELSFNGQRVGLSESEASFIKEKMDEEFKARIGVKLVVSPTVQDAAAPARVSVSVYCTFDGAAVAPDAAPTATASVGGQSIGTPITMNAGGVNHSYSGATDGKNVEQTISVTVRVKGVIFMKSVKIPAYHKIWYGVTPDESLGTDFALESTFESLRARANAAATYDFDFTSPHCYGYILVPNGVTLPSSMQGDNPSGQEGPLPVPFKKLANVTIGGVTYTQLRFATAQGICKHSVTFK